jgi:signal transduction histidine kinase
MANNNLILIVDDIQENLQVLGTMLELEGYKVLISSSGAAALDIVRDISQKKPSLILLDVLMPDLDGFEVCRRLKSDPETREIPVIFISAIGMTDHKLMAFHAGAVDYITKPFQSEEVLARVHTHLQLATIDVLRREIDERKEVEAALQKSQARLAELAVELSLTEERERKRIASALHDRVIQDLALGKLKLDQALKNGLIPAETAVIDLQTILSESMRDLRNLCSDLSSPLLYEAGLKSALESLGERLARGHGFSFTVSGDEGHDLLEDVRVSLFQIARELFINIVKHAAAATVITLIAVGEKSVSLEVVDDGVGFDLAAYQEGFGLAYIRQRVAFLGGTMKIFTAPGMGTSHIIEIPVIH